MLQRWSELQLSDMCSASYPTTADTRRRHCKSVGHSIVSSRLDYATHCCTVHRPATSTGCRLLRTLWPAERSVTPRALSVAPSYVDSSTALAKNQLYKLAVITCRINLTKNPAYLSDIIHEYHPTRTLRSADKLLLTVPRMRANTISAKAFCISAPSIWNSLSYNCRSAELLSTFRRLLKTELFDIAYSEREHSA